MLTNSKWWYLIILLYRKISATELWHHQNVSRNSLLLLKQSCRTFCPGAKCSPPDLSTKILVVCFTQWSVTYILTSTFCLLSCPLYLTPPTTDIRSLRLKKRIPLPESKCEGEDSRTHSYPAIPHSTPLFYSFFSQQTSIFGIGSWHHSKMGVDRGEVVLVGWGEAVVWSCFFLHVLTLWIQEVSKVLI